MSLMHIDRVVLTLQYACPSVRRASHLGRSNVDDPYRVCALGPVLQPPSKA